MMKYAHTKIPGVAPFKMDGESQAECHVCGYGLWESQGQPLCFVIPGKMAFCSPACTCLASQANPKIAELRRQTIYQSIAEDDTVPEERKKEITERLQESLHI